MDLNLKGADEFAHQVADIIIQKMNKESSSNIDEFLTLEEVADLIGYKQNSIYGLVKKNKIPHYKKGKLFFLKSEIFEWIKEGKKTSSSEIKKKSDQYLLENGIL